jgi:hypothetical protein
VPLWPERRYPMPVKPRPLSDQEAIGSETQRGVVTEAAPVAPLVVDEPEFLPELLVITLDAPVQFGSLRAAHRPSYKSIGV